MSTLPLLGLWLCSALLGLWLWVLPHVWQQLRLWSLPGLWLVPDWVVNLSFVEILEWDFNFSHLWEQFELWQISGCYCSSGSILGREFCFSPIFGHNFGSGHCLGGSFGSDPSSGGFCDLATEPWLCHIFICNFGLSYCSDHKFGFISTSGSCFGSNLISECSFGSDWYWTMA